MDKCPCKVHSKMFDVFFLFTDFSVATYYFTINQFPWAINTLIIIVVPLILCQIYSLWLLKCEKNQIKASAICVHLVLCGILYRYVKVQCFWCTDVKFLMFQTLQHTEKNRQRQIVQPRGECHQKSYLQCEFRPDIECHLPVLPTIFTSVVSHNLSREQIGVDR